MPFRLNLKAINSVNQWDIEHIIACKQKNKKRQFEQIRTIIRRINKESMQLNGIWMQWSVLKRVKYQRGYNEWKLEILRNDFG